MSKSAIGSWRPPADEVLKTIGSIKGHRYLGIAAKVANPKSTAIFPIVRNSVEALDYAVQAASQWWTGETDWTILGADELFDQQHIDSAELPADATLMKDPVILGEFSAG